MLSSTIDLLPREFRLLEYMMRRKEQMLTRALLLEDVWNYKFVPQTNPVDVHRGSCGAQPAISRIGSKRHICSTAQTDLFRCYVKAAPPPDLISLTWRRNLLAFFRQPL